MSVAVSEWGVRLSDRLRQALEGAGFEQAARLVREGDGLTRDLAREYALMIRGLGFTVRVLLGLLGETALRGDRGSAGADCAAAARFVRDASASLDRVVRPVWGSLIVDRDAAPGELAQEIAQAERLLAACEARCQQEQTRLAAEILGAIEAGNAAQALALLDSKEQEHYLLFHDELLRCMAQSFAWVLRRYGSEELLRFHLATAQAQRAGIEKWERMSAAEFASASAFLFKLHLGVVRVHEDDTRFTIDLPLCGSGGRLRLQGAYEEPEALPFVEGAGPLTFGQPRLPVYCSHCAVWNGVAPLQWFGHPHWVFEDAARADGSCRLHIYKQPDAVPLAYSGMLRSEPAPLVPDAPGASPGRRHDC